MTPDPRVDPAVAGFDTSAGSYEQARPSYPPEAVDLVVDGLGLAPGDRVCDLAAGTGKLTRLLADRGLVAIAVEPVVGMRDQLAAVAPGIEVLDGVAEAIPLAESSVDGVTVAQAFHWFDAPLALGEIRRVLRPGRGTAILFNRRDESTTWVRRMSEVIHWHERRINQYESIDWGALLGEHGFGAVEQATVEWEQPMTRELLAERVRSVSYIALMDADEQQDHVERVLALVDDLDEPFAMPYLTMVWWATLPA